MKLNLLVIISTILSSTSIKKIKPKLCINCKHFISTADNKFGKCGLFPRMITNNYFLVDGVNEQKEMDYYYCETARTFSNMCGQNGDFHKRKYVKKTKENFNYIEW